MMRSLALQVCDAKTRGSLVERAGANANLSQDHFEIFCEPLYGVAANTMCAHMCGVVKTSKKSHNPGAPRTPSLPKSPVPCFDEIKHSLSLLSNSSSHIREKLKRPTPILQMTEDESCRPRFGVLFSPLPTQWSRCCDVLKVGATLLHTDHHPGRVDHKRLSDPESRRPQTASAAFSCPEPEFLVAACVPVNSRTAPGRHGMITHLPEDVPEPCHPPVSHGSSVSEVDARRTRRVPSSPHVGAPHCLR